MVVPPPQKDRSTRHPRKVANWIAPWSRLHVWRPQYFADQRPVRGRWRRRWPTARRTREKAMAVVMGGQQAKGGGAGQEAPMSTSGWGQWSAAQPSTTYSGTVTNNCRPHSQAAVRADTPWLAMMGMRGTVAPVCAMRRSVQGGVTLLELVRPPWLSPPLPSCGGLLACVR